MSRAGEMLILDWFTPEVRELPALCSLYSHLCWTRGHRDKLVSLQRLWRGGKQIYDHCAKRLGCVREPREAS